MPRLNIYVNTNLHEAMQKHNADLNWSWIASLAFRRAIKAHEQKLADERRSRQIRRCELLETTT